MVRAECGTLPCNSVGSRLFTLNCIDSRGVVDGLARAKARGAADADNARGFCCGGICDWLHHWVFSDDDLVICRWCGFDHLGHRPELALLQSPSAQVVGPERSREASQTTAPTAVFKFKEEIF